MTTIEKLSIALTPELAAAVREAVGTGRYATASEVIRDALRVWLQHRSAETAWLRRAWEEGIASGPAEPLDIEEIKAEGRRRLARAAQ